MASQAERSRALTTYAMLLAAALILSYVEALIPPLGLFKLGLANIATLLGVYACSPKCGFAVMLCRVLIASLLFGSATTLAFSLCGGILAWFAATLLRSVYKSGLISLIGISVISAAAHNVGQVIAAALVLSSASVFGMLWWLLLTAIPAGLLTGICAQIVLNRIGDKL